MLEIKDLHVAIDKREVLKGLNLRIPSGEIHALMGPNGMGKSTLARLLAGDPRYEVLKGEIGFMGKDLLSLSPEERVHLGLFVSFQYPPEIPGVSLFHFLFYAFNARQKARQEKPLSEKAFGTLLDEKLSLLGMRPDFKERALNFGFSGGEKKKSEILQMALLEPSFALLDETDSGLDIDAVKRVIDSIKKIKKKENALLIITHYLRLFDHLKPDQIHILFEGKIIASGGLEIVRTLEERGYQPFLQ